MRHRRALWSTGLALLLAILAAELLAVFLWRGVPQKIPARLVLQLVSVLGYFLLGTVWIRALVGAELGRTADDACRGLGAAAFRYMARSIVWMLPALLVMGTGLLVWFGLFGSSLQGPPDKMPPSMIAVAVLCFLIAGWVTLRLFPYPFAGAVGQRDIGLVEAWRVTEGNVLRISGILGLYYFVGIVIAFVLGMTSVLILVVDRALLGDADPTLGGLLVAKLANVLWQAGIAALCSGVIAEIYTRLFVSRSQLDT